MTTGKKMGRPPGKTRLPHKRVCVICGQKKVLKEEFHPRNSEGPHTLLSHFQTRCKMCESKAVVRKSRHDYLTKLDAAGLADLLERTIIKAADIRAEIARRQGAPVDRQGAA